MDLNEIKKRIADREQELINIKNKSDSQVDQINLALQEDYQALVFYEVNSESKNRNEIRQLRTMVSRQQNLLKKYQQIRFGKLVYKNAPKIPVLKNAILAFLVGGTICAIGQVILNAIVANGVATKEATSITGIIMVFAGALLTGIGIYDEIGRFGGAGSMVPITGFANSIVSPALEFKKEGYVYGIGAKVFTIAGPVLLYGSLVSVIIGLLYYFLG